MAFCPPDAAGVTSGVATVSKSGSGEEAVTGCRSGGGEMVVVRAAKLADADRLAVLCAQLGYPASSEEVRRRLAPLQQSDEHGILVADTADGQVIGWVHVFVRQLLVVDRHAELGGLVVDAGHRGYGVGHLLVAEAESWAQAKGCEAVYVRSNIVREDAHRFYDGIGYERLKTSRVFLKKVKGGV